jgi:hypothetical protein
LLVERFAQSLPILADTDNAYERGRRPPALVVCEPSGRLA